MKVNGFKMEKLVNLMSIQKIQKHDLHLYIENIHFRRMLENVDGSSSDIHLYLSTYSATEMVLRLINELLFNNDHVLEAEIVGENVTFYIPPIDLMSEKAQNILLTIPNIDVFKSKINGIVSKYIIHEHKEHLSNELIKFGVFTVK